MFATERKDHIMILDEESEHYRIDCRDWYMESGWMQRER